MIFLTGASGFLGRAVMLELVARGERVRCLSRRKPAGPVDWVKADLSADTLPDNIMDGCDCVIHCAAEIKGTPEYIKQVNIEATKKLIQLAERLKIRRFIFISSIDAVLFETAYSMSKRKGEELLKASALNWIIIRPSLIFGLQDSKNISLLNKLVKISPLLPAPFGGDFCWEPVYVNDLSTFIVNKALQAHEEGATYNVVGPEKVSFKQLLQILAAHNKAKRLILPLSDGVTGSLRWITEKIYGKDKSDSLFSSFSNKIIGSDGKDGAKIVLPTRISAVYNGGHSG